MALTPTAKPTPELLPGLPRKALSPEQQLEALRRVQAQAEQRVQLGMQLFKAAEARVAEQRDVLAEVRAEGDALREQITGDVTKTLQQYDQWIGKIDESFTVAMRDLVDRMDKIESSVAGNEDRLRHMLARTEALILQAQKLIGGETSAAARPPATAAAAKPPVIAPMPTPLAKKPEPAPAPKLTAEQPTNIDPSKDGKIYSHLLKRLRGEGPSEKAA